MYKLKYICGGTKKEDRQDINRDAAEKLLADILGVQLPDEPRQQPAPAVKEPCMIELGRRVATLCSKHNNLADQTSIVCELDDDEFLADKGILLARTLVKARLEGMLLLGDLYDKYQEAKNENPELVNMIRVVQLVVAQYNRMSKDLDERFMAFCGLDTDDMKGDLATADRDTENVTAGNGSVPEDEEPAEKSLEGHEAENDEGENGLSPEFMQLLASIDESTKKIHELLFG